MVTQLVLMCFGCEAAPSPAHYFFLSCPLFPLLIHVARRYNIRAIIAMATECNMEWDPIIGRLAYQWLAIASGLGWLEEHFLTASLMSSSKDRLASKLSQSLVTLQMVGMGQARCCI